MRFLSRFTLALLLGGSYTASADVLYSVTDLGTLGGNSSNVTGINNEGQIVGASYTSSGVSHAFLYAAGQMRDLGTLGGTNSQATAINNAGQVTGYSATSSSGAQAFLYSDGQMANLGTSSLAYSYGRGINAKGQVVGSASTASGSNYAFLYADGQLRNLDALGGNSSSSYAYGINNAGQIVGVNAGHAFIYNGGPMMNLGTLSTLPGDYSQANGINDAGQVTGYFNNSSTLTHAFLYSNGQITDLGSVPGFPYSFGEAINSEGQVVGQLAGVGSNYGVNDAFLYRNGVTVDLNSLIDPNLQTRLTIATGINDLGQIVADGNNGRAYLLTPVPEPGTLALLGLAWVGLGAWVRRAFPTSRCQDVCSPKA